MVHGSFCETEGEDGQPVKLLLFLDISVFSHLLI